MKAECQVQIDAAPEQVWATITDTEQLGQAFFGIVSVVPNKVLKLTHWSPMSGTEDKPENYHTITLKMAPAGGGTELSLTQDNVSSEEERKHSAANWSKMLDNIKELAEH